MLQNQQRHDIAMGRKVTDRLEPLLQINDIAASCQVDLLGMIHENVAQMNLSEMGAAHIPTAPSFSKSGIMAVHEPRDLRDWRPTRRRINRAHQEAGYVEGVGPEMALQTACWSGEFRVNLGLVQSIKDRTAMGIHRGQIDDGPAGGPADGNLIAKINGPRSSRTGVFALRTGFRKDQSLRRNWNPQSFEK